MSLSIEVPVFKGRFLRPCIDSVLAQSSDAWRLSLVWDGGDEASRRLLEQLQARGHPRIRVYFTENRGIAAARRFLSERSEQPYILPLDDDDVLPPGAVERFVRAAQAWPWASLIRARRDFIDEEGAVVDEPQWFPFGPRHYQRGMVTDLFNQAQPYLIRRSAYERTCGWRGFSDFMGAGEDCDLFLQLEEVAHFELIDEVLYRYRLHGDRASHRLTPPAAFEMWRRLADEGIARLGLPLRRITEAPPFVYERQPRASSTLDDVDFVTRSALVAAALRQQGVAPDARLLVPDTSGWKMAGFHRAQRKLICWLGESVQIAGRSTLEALVQALDAQDADLLSPHVTDSAAAHLPQAWPLAECLLSRREVLLGTGGFDDGFVSESLQDVDLWLQARRRGFRCARAQLAGLQQRSAGGSAARWTAARWTAAELGQLRAKWRSHPALLELAD